MCWLEEGEYEITLDSRGPGWVAGDRVTVPMTLTFQEESVTTGSSVGSPVTVTLPTLVKVERAAQGTPNSVDPAANATITGTLRRADTLQPYANTDIVLDSASTSRRMRTDANGQLSAAVFAYQRSGGAPDWREFLVRLDSTTRHVPAAVVIPKSGETTAVDVSETESDAAITVARGYGELPEVVAPGTSGSRIVEMKPGERIEIRVPRGVESASQLGPGGQRRPLPIGSTFDAATQTFYWQPAAGFLGRFRIVFSTGTERISVTVVVAP